MSARFAFTLMVASWVTAIAFTLAGKVAGSFAFTLLGWLAGLALIVVSRRETRDELAARIARNYGREGE